MTAVIYPERRTTEGRGEIRSDAGDGRGMREAGGEGRLDPMRGAEEEGGMREERGDSEWCGGERR
jgi:hypothetical protein